MSLKLIKEMVQEVEYLTEGAEGHPKTLYIQGPFLQAGIPNRNKRFYPESVMEEAVNTYSNQFIISGRAYGELGHPDTPTINPDRISHRTVALTKEGKNWIGKAKISNTPMGNIARNLMEDGGKLAVSSRGLGNLKEMTSYNEVQRGFILTTAADIVIDPSAPDAFVSGILEGKEWVWDNGILKESEISKISKEIKALSRVDLEANLIESFKSFLSKL